MFEWKEGKEKRRERNSKVEGLEIEQERVN